MKTIPKKGKAALLRAASFGSKARSKCFGRSGSLVRLEGTRSQKTAQLAAHFLSSSKSYLPSGVGTFAWRRGFVGSAYFCGSLDFSNLGISVGFFEKLFCMNSPYAFFIES